MDASLFRRTIGPRGLVLVLGLCAGAALPEQAAGLQAADAPVTEAAARWSDTAEFSYVVTAGNSETNTLGLRNSLRRAWEKSAFRLDAGGVRVSSTRKAVIAVGPSDTSFSVLDAEPETAAENYFVTGRFDRSLTKRTFWFAGAGWDRNRFAGIQNRYAGFGGVGNVWLDRERVKFRTDYALTYTRQEDVIENPDVSDTYAGLRLGWNYLRLLGRNTTYGNDLIVDGNLDATSDLRANMTNWMAVSMSARMALKVSLQWLFDNEPAFKQVERQFPLGTPTGQTVLVGLDTLDSVFTASLVVTF